MKITHRSTRNSLLVVLLATGASLAVFIPLAVSAAPKAEAGDHGATAKGEAGEGGEEREGLEANMKSMQAAFRQLGEQVSDKAQNASSLELIAKMEKATLEAKGELPPRVSRMPEEERAKAAAGYRGMIVNLLKTELELEEQLLAGDNAKAAETMATLKEIEKQGHSEYRGRGKRQPKPQAGGESHEAAPSTRPSR